MTILKLRDLTEVQGGWNNLLSKSMDNHPFLTSEWITPWWKHFGKDKELRLFASQNEHGISLLIPVMYSKFKVLGSTRRYASFVTNPDSDYHGFIITDLQDAAKNMRGLLDCVIGDSGADCVMFGEVPEYSATAKLLEGINGEGFTISPSTVNVCPFIPLPNSFELYYQNLGSNMRRNLKVWEKQVLKDYRVDFVKYDKIGSVAETMDIFFELHQKRELSIGNRGVFADDVTRRFHKDAAEMFAANGWLSLFFLTLNDEPVSALYSFEYNGKLYGYLCGFDPEFGRYRVGNLVFKKMIEYSIQRNLKEFDFLRGDEEYKERWKATLRHNLEFKLNKSDLVSRFYNWNRNNRPLSLLDVRSKLKRVASKKDS
jgi:CelD/BcsL family acetyltransferase involved in cellulose biosynthesis